MKLNKKFKLPVCKDFFFIHLFVCEYMWMSERRNREKERGREGGMERRREEGEEGRRKRVTEREHMCLSAPVTSCGNELLASTM